MTQKPKDKKLNMSKNVVSKSNNINSMSNDTVSKNKVASKRATILETILDVGKNLSKSSTSQKIKKALSDTANKAQGIASQEVNTIKVDLINDSNAIKSSAIKEAKKAEKDLKKKAKIAKSSAIKEAKKAEKALAQKAKVVKASAIVETKKAKKDLNEKANVMKASAIKEIKKVAENLDEKNNIVKDSSTNEIKKIEENLSKKNKAVKNSATKEVKKIKANLDEKNKTVKSSTIKKVKSIKKEINSKTPKGKKSIGSKLSSSKTVAKKVEDFLKENKPIILEYYDLPYKYNKTVVKVLAQNPNTLFVYWEISDEDHANLEKQYGERFFYITKPVLIVTNLTENYSYEIDIDDFASNWYIHVNDSKCKYKVELGRRPIEITQEIPVAYLPISSSNIIEAPNDHVLFFKEGDKIYFKNLKTNIVTERTFKSSNYSKNLKEIYGNYKLSEEENRFDFKNPSSQNPTSNVM